MDWSPESGSQDFVTLQALYASGALEPADVIRAAYARFDRADHVWITRVPLADALARARELGRDRSKLPLYGLPFAVKDSIDVAGLPTTGACPEFAYTPKTSATVVDRLTQAGAIVVGKSNLDQFGTGLVGVRSPYGPVQNPFDARYISGGSSSGSAVAVSSGMVSFALGTDTAGSGRVPAGFNNIVGLKPTRGVLSYAGVLASCRTIDCVAVMALTCADARMVMNLAKGFDAADVYSRPAANSLDLFPPRPASFRFGVPSAAELNFFGDGESPALFEKAIPLLEAMGGKRVEIDFTPFRETATLLYGGPWVAERLAALKDFYAAHADAFLPVTRKIIGGATRYTAVDTFEAYYALEKLKRRAAAQWGQMDFMLVPTTGTIYTVKQVEADPIDLNTNLGYYTNFVNLLDCCALALPCAFRKNGLPFGVTFIAPALADGLLCTLGSEYQSRLGGKMGATRTPVPAPEPRS